MPQAHSALVRPPLPRAALGAHQPVVAVEVVAVEAVEPLAPPPLEAGLLPAVPALGPSFADRVV